MTLKGDLRGVTIVEFAVVTPVLLLIVLGGLEVGYSAWVRSALEGEMQKASRDRALESAGAEDQRKLLEDRVRKGVQQVAPRAVVTFTRRAYKNFAEVTASAEEFNDANGNGRCDANETYLDSNGNEQWDTQTGTGGSDGGAMDVVVYAAKVQYASPTGNFLKMGANNVIEAKTALRNQPYDNQSQPLERSCK